MLYFSILTMIVSVAFGLVHTFYKGERENLKTMDMLFAVYMLIFAGFIFLQNL